MLRLPLVLLVVVTVLAVGGCNVGVQPQSQGSPKPQQPHPDLYQDNIEQAVAYLESQYDRDIQLLAEAKGPGGGEIGREICPDKNAWLEPPPWEECKSWKMDQVYWLGDNALAWMALQLYNPQVAGNIQSKLEQTGCSEYASSDLPDILSGQRIEASPPRIQKRVYIDHSEGEYLIIGGERVDDYLRPINHYSDVMLQYSIQSWRSGNKRLARQYLRQVLSKWDGIGIWDRPAKARSNDQYQDLVKNEAAVYKLALLLITVQVLDYPFSAFHDVEAQIWDHQDPDTGGIRTGIKPDGSIAGGCNTETTSLALLIYDEERIDMLRQPFSD
ncbi:MAG: hypothetical protein ACLFPU_07020 [Dehalococcoidia bacterium]